MSQITTFNIDDPHFLRSVFADEECSIPMGNIIDASRTTGNFCLTTGQKIDPCEENITWFSRPPTADFKTLFPIQSTKLFKLTGKPGYDCYREFLICAFNEKHARHKAELYSKQHGGCEQLGGNDTYNAKSIYHKNRVNRIQYWRLPFFTTCDHIANMLELQDTDVVSSSFDAA